MSLKKLAIIGAGGFGREVAWLVERINQKCPTWKIMGFIDDNLEVQGKVLNGYSVIGTVSDVSSMNDIFFVVAIGSSKTRRKIVERIENTRQTVNYATLIDPTVKLSQYVSVGEGSIICAQSVLTVNINVGEHVLINLDCTVGHDVEIKDFVTLYPGVHLSGLVKVGKCTELGTGMQTKQGITIGKNVVVGAGAVVIDDIPGDCTAVGNPANKFF